ncbi:MAG TPA: hypothetical protein VG815_07505, partial [Chloroflexota bacterium]|nr:hypothetical protein [Chloroflexota bacterium]
TSRDSDPVLSAHNVPVTLPTRTASLLLRVAVAVGLSAMVIALFLPWASASGASQGLSDYGAPTPTIAAWVLLALGAAIAIVAAFSLVFGGERSVPAVAAGSLLYLIGTFVWYGASVLPSVVASGCRANGGPLCQSPTVTSPVIAGTGVRSGFVLAVIASAFVLAVALAAIRSSMMIGAARQASE